MLNELAAHFEGSVLFTSLLFAGARAFAKSAAGFSARAGLLVTPGRSSQNACSPVGGLPDAPWGRLARNLPFSPLESDIFTRLAPISLLAATQRRGPAIDWCI